MPDLVRALREQRDLFVAIAGYQFGSGTLTGDDALKGWLAGFLGLLVAGIGQHHRLAVVAETEAIGRMPVEGVEDRRRGRIRELQCGVRLGRTQADGGRVECGGVR